MGRVGEQCKREREKEAIEKRRRRSKPRSCRVGFDTRPSRRAGREHLQRGVAACMNGQRAPWSVEDLGHAAACERVPHPPCAAMVRVLL